MGEDRKGGSIRDGSTGGIGAVAGGGGGHRLCRLAHFRIMVAVHFELKEIVLAVIEAAALHRQRDLWVVTSLIALLIGTALGDLLPKHFKIPEHFKI